MCKQWPQICRSKTRTWRASGTRGGVRFLTYQMPDRFRFFDHERSSPPRPFDALLTLLFL